MDIRIGISGWVYPLWRGIFYPEDLPHKQELFFASRQVSSIEINGSFYAYQNSATYQRWYSQVPDDFVFSVKGPQYITHVLRLKEVQQPLANFFASGVLYLQTKLGPILWQLPPNFLCDFERLESFFKVLPKTVAEAAQLAAKSERFPQTYNKEFFKNPQPLHHCLEVRHHSFENPDFISLLRKYNVALVFADTAGKWPYMEDVTSDFIYIRLHGDEEIYTSGYDAATLRGWADRIKTWASQRQPRNALTMSTESWPLTIRHIYVYFDNDLKVKAPHDAQTLMSYLMKKIPLTQDAHH